MGFRDWNFMGTLGSTGGFDSGTAGRGAITLVNQVATKQLTNANTHWQPNNGSHVHLNPSSTGEIWATKSRGAAVPMPVGVA